MLWCDSLTLYEVYAVLGWGCAAQAEAHLKYRMRACSTGWGTSEVQNVGVQHRLRHTWSTERGCAAQAEAQLKYRTRVCSTGWDTPEVQNEGVQHRWGNKLSACVTACNAHPQTVPHSLVRYCTTSPCIAHISYRVGFKAVGHTGEVRAIRIICVENLRNHRDLNLEKNK